MSEEWDVRLLGGNYLSAGMPQGFLQRGWLGGKKSPWAPGHGFKSWESCLGFTFPRHSPKHLPPPSGQEPHHSGARRVERARTANVTITPESQRPPLSQLPAGVEFPPPNFRWIRDHSSSLHASGRPLTRCPDVKTSFLLLNQRLFSCNLSPSCSHSASPLTPHPQTWLFFLPFAGFAELLPRNPDLPPIPPRPDLP